MLDTRGVLKDGKNEKGGLVRELFSDSDVDLSSARVKNEAMWRRREETRR